MKSNQEVINQKIDEIIANPAIKDLFKRYTEANPLNDKEFNKFINLIASKRVGYLFGRCVRQYKDRGLYNPQLKKYFSYQRRVKKSNHSPETEELITQLQKNDFSVVDNSKKIIDAVESKAAEIFNRVIMESISEMLMEQLTNGLYRLPEKNEFIEKLSQRNKKLPAEIFSQVYDEMKA